MSGFQAGNGENTEAKWVRLPTHAFGFTFTEIPDFIRNDLSSLERECVLYADHWVDELDDFRHVRITFTPDEAADYARRTWAYELFLRSGEPEWAKDVPEIDPEVAHDADSYVMKHIDSTTIGPPYHCFAAFLGRYLEALTCGGYTEREMIIELQGKESLLFTLDRAIQALTPAIRSFNARERGLTPWPVTREDDIRDLLYAMLKPSIFDLVKEETTPSLAGTHRVIDLCSNASRMAIEVKWIGQAGRWKRVLDEVRIDMQSYPNHPSCETLVFLIVDAVRDVPDPRLIERQLSGKQVICGRQVDIRLFVVEP